jgi:diguanylate cyclase (GGDEF)-like protein
MAKLLQNLGAPTTFLGRKLGVAIGLPVLFAALAGLGFTWSAATRAAQHDTEEEASALADLIAVAFDLEAKSQPGDEPHREVVSTLQTHWRSPGAVDNVRVVNRAGIVRWSRRTEEQGQPATGFEKAWLEGPQGTLHENTFTLPVGGASCAACHVGDSMHLGAVQLQLAPPKRLGELDEIYRLAMGGTLTLSALFLVALSWALRRYVTRPVKRLSQAMDRARSGDFLVRVPVESTDEIGALASGFNSMLARITDLKVAELETHQDMERMQRELSLKAELEQKQTQLEATNKKLEGTVKELSLLYELTRSVNSTLELEPLLSLISELVGHSLGYVEFSVMLVDDSGQELMHQSGYGEHGAVKGEMRFRVGEGAAGSAAHSQEVVYVEDIAQDPRFVRRDNEVGSLLCVPMVFKGDLVGVLNFRKTERCAFGEDEVRLLQSVANQAAMAIVNARLYQATVELSITDALTGAFNRRHLFTRLELEVMRAQRFGHPLSVVMIDIDHFKIMNDNNGHAAGDQVLRLTAELLKNQLRKVDTLARYGGEEFIVMLPQNSKSEALEVAEKLRRAVERTQFAHGERQPLGKVTISVGVGSFPEDAPSLELLIDAADSALYASKRGGRNMVSGYRRGMEDHPGRERGPKARQRAQANAQSQSSPASTNAPTSSVTPPSSDGNASTAAPAVQAKS